MTPAIDIFERTPHWIVVPCFNEAHRLPAAIFRDWLKEHGDFGMIFVDDGSNDGTAALIETICQAVPQQARLLKLPANAGKGEAIRRGLLQLLDPAPQPGAASGTAAAPQTVGYLDADLATPLDELSALLETLQRRPDCDIVLGSRVRLLGRDIHRDPLRHYLGRVFAAATSLVLGLAVYDTQCGAKLFRVSERTGPLLDAPFVSRWAFDVEIIARYLRRVRPTKRWPGEPCGLIEVPLRSWHDVAGSKVRPRDFFRALLDLCKIARRYGRGEREPVFVKGRA